MSYKIQKEESQWREQLSPEAYRITREAGTERAFTGRFYNHKEAGMYRCIGCGVELFDSAHKFDSGTGWPSYWAPAQSENIEERADRSHGMIRTEVRCNNCGAHLGHLFPDGPQPSGLRYCINSAALEFEPTTEG